MNLTRRSFLAGSAAGAAMAAAAGDKLTDGGLAPVTAPGAARRAARVLPAGAGSAAAFDRRCVGCQLCVAACPEGVLAPRAGLGGAPLRPEMGFLRGHCRPSCSRCGEVCPAGAIRPLSAAEKLHVHVGRAVWNPKACLATTEGVECHACERHCPVKAIVRVPLEPGKKDSPLVPQVDPALCIGCGACEHLCPARPLPAIVVEGYAVHRVVTKMGEQDLLAEAKRLIAEGASVVLLRDGLIVSSASGRGVQPLLDLLDRRPGDFKGAWVVDKIVGRAAAALFVRGGVQRVHALVASEGALEFLEEHGVAAAADETTAAIANREGTGECPLEQAVKGLSEPEAMEKAVRVRVQELRAAAK